MATPSEVIDKYLPCGEEMYPESGGAISGLMLSVIAAVGWEIQWQWAYYKFPQRLEPLIHEADDPEFLKLWRYFQISDHLYYMFVPQVVGQTGSFIF